MKDYDFRVFDKQDDEVCKIEGEKEYTEHDLQVGGGKGEYYEWCGKCGKAWNLTNEQAKEIWGV